MAKKQIPPGPQDQPDKQPGHPNLRRGGFEPGRSGNPGGRPRGKSILAELRACLDKTTLNGEQIKGGLTAKAAMCEAIFRHAINGNPAYAKLLIEQLCGRPIIRIHQTAAIDGGNGEPIPPHVAEAGMRAMLEAIGEHRGPDA